MIWPPSSNLLIVHLQKSTYWYIHINIRYLLYFNLNHIYIFVSLHTFWSYPAIYGLTLFLIYTNFHNKLFLGT
jgi:hypothetical protein